MMEMLDPEQDEFCDLEIKKLEARETRYQGKFFNRCTFIKCNFNGTVFQNCRFRYCAFKNCDLGLVNLKGKSTWERAEALVSIAHPECQDQLVEECKKANIWRRSNKR